MVAYIILWL